MARIRSVHPELCIDETLAGISATAERTFIRLWPHLDDEGRTRDNTRLIRAACYPLHDDVTSADVETDLDELASAGLIIRYQVDGDRYLTAKPESWKRWQKPRHFYPSKLPAPADTAQDDTSDMNVGPASDERPTTAPLELRVVELRGVEEGAAAPTSDVRPTSVRLSAEQRRQLFDQAITILTDRHLAKYPTTGSNPARHRSSVMNGKRGDYGELAHKALHDDPTMTADQLAAVLEPGSAPLLSDDDLVAAFTPSASVKHNGCCDGHGNQFNTVGEWAGHCQGASE